MVKCELASSLLSQSPSAQVFWISGESFWICKIENVFGKQLRYWKRLNWFERFQSCKWKCLGWLHYDTVTCTDISNGQTDWTTWQIQADWLFLKFKEISHTMKFRGNTSLMICFSGKTSLMIWLSVIWWNVEGRWQVQHSRLQFSFPHLFGIGQPFWPHGSLQKGNHCQKSFIGSSWQEMK